MANYNKTNPMIQQVFGTSPMDIKKINDNFQNLDSIVGEISNNKIPSIEVADEAINTDVTFSNNGTMLTITKDDVAENWDLTLDGYGKITSMTNGTRTINIAY